MTDIQLYELRKALGDKSDDDVCIVEVELIRALMDEAVDADTAYKDGYDDCARDTVQGFQ